MKYTIPTVLLCLWFSIAFAQNNQQEKGPGTCSTYTIEGNKVTFGCEGGAGVQLSLLSKSVVKVWYEPSGRFSRSNESFAVINEQLEEMGQLHVEEQAQAFEIFTDFLRIRVNKAPFQLQIFDKYQKLLLSDYGEKGFVQRGEQLSSYKSLRSDEQFFGLGEKAGPLNRRGRVYKMWNSDKPCYSTTEDPLYKSIPFFISNYNYGIFFDNTYKTVFDFGKTSDDYYSFSAPGGEMLYYFMFGRDYKEIIGSYTQLTGKPIMPPKWAFGFSQSRGLLTREDLSLEIAKGYRDRNIPCDIIYQDIGWTQHLQDFEWRKGNYEDPKRMLIALAEDGFKVIVSQDPVISQANVKQWREADSLQFFALDARTGNSYDMPWPWGGNAGVVDFTKPAVADWWGRYQQKPLNDGVKGFWTDMGEPAWSNEDAPDRLFMQHHLGMHDEIHNVYGLSWDKVVKEQFEKHNPNQRIFQMTRAAYAGLQRYTFGWSGDAGNGYDVNTGWNQLANQIPLSLSAGMGLIPFWSCDISGYCGDIEDYEALAPLYTRWIQFGVFNPLSRAHHEGNNAVEPWLFGPEAEKSARKAIELKYQLFPYIYTYGREAYDTGLPLMRAMLLEYSDDEEAVAAEHQFLFGKELLVAPVVKKGALTKEVYLPDGEWIDFADKKTHYQGSRRITYNAPLDVVPVFVKKGSIIPMMPIMQYIHQNPVYPVHLEVFPAANNQQATFVLYEDDGENNDYQQNIYCKTIFSCLTKEEGYEFTVAKREEQGYAPEGKRNLLIKLYLQEKPKKVLVNAAKVNSTKADKLLSAVDQEFDKSSWSWDAAKGICYVKVHDRGEEQKVQILK
ncbi:glycoside hydrolase family 31 protein [Cesiribacter sp. SM1]|uniref:glycoside hydrolase family 31 protein n=1 Tax=Cesiribacter sp. SM1 TaxID=2861196 RepID=UPI001CD4F10B|nr:glycoside hydrolase family 31 protein [Cesiribacter sp. SM1]